MKNDNYLVIMAGGIGSRFWPMSTTDMPKQFVDVLGCGKTLIQLTTDRFEGVVPPENVWVVTSERYASIVREQLPSIPESNILKEPCRRNTAPCIAYVSWCIKARNPKANIVVSPSDHIVLDVREFQRVIKSALDFVSESDAMVTLGMKPTRPETGYGYIDKKSFSVCIFGRILLRNLHVSSTQALLRFGTRLQRKSLKKLPQATFSYAFCPLRVQVPFI